MWGWVKQSNISRAVSPILRPSQGETGGIEVNLFAQVVSRLSHPYQKNHVIGIARLL